MFTSMTLKYIDYMLRCCIKYLFMELFVGAFRFCYAAVHNAHCYTIHTYELSRRLEECNASY